MIVRDIEDIKNSSREVFAENGNWVSRRLILQEDNMGFSFHETVIYPNTETLIWYKNHLEAVYCIEGEGEIETTKDGTIYPIKPGTMYALDKNDRHYLRAFDKDLRLVCVFNPALLGDEIHDKDGSY
ncbi:MAG: L-ectoine synthase [Methanobacteriales archaeon HGW-Methanobacteriales-1]|jgi:L-ectoine synthase|nr:MAG: L-ectoine synthase [Methanobacteriales archaeon HGW-Methanobacteriales-1]